MNPLLDAILTVENHLKAIYDLQKIDSKIDEIRKIRGELPIEVSELEDDIEGLRTRLRNLETEVEEYTVTIKNNQQKTEDANNQILKYEKQLSNVKNNREFEAINKEIEMQRLDIDLAGKRARDAQREIENREKNLNETKTRLELKKKELEHKKKELEVIIADTQKEEQELLEHSKKAENQVDARWITYYSRLRRTYKNGLAVAVVYRNSCGGCFGKIPPQRQMEIRQHKRLILCEHCGRILVDPLIDGTLQAENE